MCQYLLMNLRITMKKMNDENYLNITIFIFLWNQLWVNLIYIMYLEIEYYNIVYILICNMFLTYYVTL